jgi:class 3 adenylate cyclase
VADQSGQPQDDPMAVLAALGEVFDAISTSGFDLDQVLQTINRHAIGNVVILASRLSDAAAPSEILISQRLNAAVEKSYVTESADDQVLKGFSRPVPAFKVIKSK